MLSFFMSKWTILIISFSLIDIQKDRKKIPWLAFLPIGLLMFWITYTLYAHRAYPWLRLSMLFFPGWKLHWNWDRAFRSIPLNSGWIFRIIRAAPMDYYFRFVYRGAFYLNLWTCVFRGFFARDARKMLHYMFGGFVIQMIVIMPFYYFVNLHEVWWVLGQPDHLQRHLAGSWLWKTIGDCFPSMHTSCSVGILLLALREKSRLFRWTMVVYCASIVFATLYLEVHWALDVIAGAILAYIGVKVSDLCMMCFWDILPSRVIQSSKRVRTTVEAP